MTDNHPTVIGKAIKEIRHQKGLKLAGVSRQISVSTLNAIEHGRMVPSLALTDAITAGLGLPDGSLDLPLLASARDISLRTALVHRLHRHFVPSLNIQRALRQVVRDSALPPLQRAHAQLLSAELLLQRGSAGRAYIIAHHLSQSSTVRGTLTMEVLSFLGKVSLALDRPDEALRALVQATHQKPRNAAWESAMCNLGLAWWKAGQYRAAEDQWLEAACEVREPKRQANAYLGLGLVAFRTSRFGEAKRAYHETLRIYQSIDASDNLKLRVLNNLLACAIKQQDWSEAELLVHQAHTLDATDLVLWGEWLTTQAEFANARGQTAETLALIEEAKQYLGSSLVVSWFTARMLEMAIRADDRPVALLRDIQEQLTRVPDKKLVGALETQLAQRALALGSLDDVGVRLQNLRAVFPEI